MPIPDYQGLMFPLLKAISDGEERMLSDITDVLADQFHLTENEREELLPSGSQPVFRNRVSWARTYLKKAGLLDSPRRGRIRITKRGVEVLKSNPSRIDVQFLKQFPEFVEFQSAPRKAETDIVSSEVSQTPRRDLGTQLPEHAESFGSRTARANRAVFAAVL